MGPTKIMPATITVTQRLRRYQGTDDVPNPDADCSVIFPSKSTMVSFLPDADPMDARINGVMAVIQMITTSTCYSIVSKQCVR